MRPECFWFIDYTTSILTKLSIWCFEHSGDISFSLLVSLTHTDESLEVRNSCLLIYALNWFMDHSLGPYFI